ncbi:FAD-binding domain-containing protein [Mycena indigotica]|uniref:FAD-binding domain-containing protein n=1 Tax=Mycena indigotica TaxID=2126181 RepID=A0A8H6T6P4_9AGAR|nr:FAD-binding domain-containing protein [Mycena indigotica]KAF7312068.1 FAD-binding domain-containing protein [Mycena indigotica]
MATTQQVSAHKKLFVKYIPAQNMVASMVFFFLWGALAGWVALAESGPPIRCRNIPNSIGYPNSSTWAAFNTSISGRLINAVPTAKYCATLVGGCTDAQWTSSVFRGSIPGSMCQTNWEQGYDLTPPSVCLRNGTTCGQGDVSLYSVEAETIEDIQTAVKFASQHDLRLAVKSSGHDYLGRSTAPYSLLIRVVNFKQITFTEDFIVENRQLGPAVTFGSGVYAHELYAQMKTAGRIAVAGVASTVAPGGGQIQGGGHSALSPALGLVSDNALEFKVVDARGELLHVNNISHPDLFYALRGGGAGSWGVIISTTVRTFPSFNATLSTLYLGAESNAAAAELAALHASRIFDWDSVNAGQYFWLLKNAADAADPDAPSAFVVLTYLPNTTVEQSEALLMPFFNASLSLPGVLLVEKQALYSDINNILFSSDDSIGTNVFMGSRLIPDSLYRHSPERVRTVYKHLLDDGATAILGHMIVLPNQFADSASLEQINSARRRFQTVQLPVLEQLSGPHAGSYSNEADNEPSFQTTFFGPNYGQLSAIKAKYDPNDLFIVAAGVAVVEMPVAQQPSDDKMLCGQNRAAQNDHPHTFLRSISRAVAGSERTFYPLSEFSGRLVNVVPSAKYCADVGCTDAQWASATFRGTIPGAMCQPNWEQGYDFDPPSLCLRNDTTCGQGNVPLYSVEAEIVDDAAVRFASKYDLRLVVKSSGHDNLGRSTAPNSLLLRVTKFKQITLVNDFVVAGERLGPAVTFGSGVYARELYAHTKLQGRIAVAGSASTVAPGGGQIQGGGHSALSPALGLVSDNALGLILSLHHAAFNIMKEFSVVDAAGDLLQVNSASHPDLFYALRGGGAGSWGVLISTTVRTYPTFNATFTSITLSALNNAIVSQLASLHASHIFDWDSVNAGQYFYILKDTNDATNPDAPSAFLLLTYMANTTLEQSSALLDPFIDASLAIPGVSLADHRTRHADINEILAAADDTVAVNLYMGSRFVPEALYRDSPEKVGVVYKQLLDNGTTAILGHIVAGGQVSRNAHINSAVHPGWRTAKTHILLVNRFEDSTSLDEIRSIRERFQQAQLPVLEQLSGHDAGSYSNEADIEPAFQTTFFGPNYARLSAIKGKYDPNDLFIVAAGVGSERWDQWGICRR